MKNKLALMLFCFVLCISCNAQQTVNKFPVGKWIVISEQMSFASNGKVTKVFPLETVAKEDAYIYNFVSTNTLSVTNIDNDFDWKFKIESNKNQLNLVNINGDAEDDSLTYSYVNDKLVLKRVMEDTDPDDEDVIIDVITTMTLRKI